MLVVFVAIVVPIGLIMRLGEGSLRLNLILRLPLTGLTATGWAPNPLQ